MATQHRGESLISNLTRQLEVIAELWTLSKVQCLSALWSAGERDLDVKHLAFAPAFLTQDRLDRLWAAGQQQERVAQAIVDFGQGLEWHPDSHAQRPSTTVDFGMLPSFRARSLEALSAANEAWAAYAESASQVAVRPVKTVLREESHPDAPARGRRLGDDAFMLRTSAYRTAMALSMLQTMERAMVKDPPYITTVEHHAGVEIGRRAQFAIFAGSAVIGGRRFSKACTEGLRERPVQAVFMALEEEVEDYRALAAKELEHGGRRPLLDENALRVMALTHPATVEVHTAAENAR